MLSLVPAVFKLLRTSMKYIIQYTIVLCHGSISFSTYTNIAENRTRIITSSQRNMLSRTFIIALVFVALAFSAEGKTKGRCWRSGTRKYGCVGVSRLSNLDNAPDTVKSIWFESCEIQNLPNNLFFRFRNKLMSIDMHNAGIEAIDSGAFNGLTKLTNLSLWGNRLTGVYEVWFANLTQLKILDLSFNKISYIEETVFTKIPNLEKLYIDSNYLVVFNWNVFTYLGNLKRVKLDKNPWDWWDRAKITQQLDNLHVDYSCEWNDYSWINHVVWDCIEKHDIQYRDDRVLDCVSLYILNESSKLLSSVQKITDCNAESNALYQCSMTSGSSQNMTITPNIAVRKILQGLIGVSQSMRHPDARYSLNY